MSHRRFRMAALLLVPTLACAASGVASDTTIAVSVDRTQAIARQELLAGVPRSERIVLRAKLPVKHRVTVFTDIDCPYCRRFHEQVDDYLQAGIEVQYLFYPRAGLDSPAYAKAVAVWCSRDRKATLASALGNRAFPVRRCKSPVAGHYELAVRMGLLGTPALITEDGDVIYGAVSAARLLERLESTRLSLPH